MSSDEEGHSSDKSVNISHIIFVCLDSTQTQIFGCLELENLNGIEVLNFLMRICLFKTKTPKP